MSSEKTKKKRIRPFRVKQGSIVAIRSKFFEQEAKKKRKTLHWQWLNPIPDLDLSINLIGQQIRCILPPEVNKDNLEQQQDTNSRTFEGEVIAIHENTSSHLQVSLLVSSNVLPFISLHNAVEYIKDEIVESALKKSELRNRKLEQKIQGLDSCEIKIILPRIQTKKTVRWAIRKRIPSNPDSYLGDGNDSVEQQQKNVRWVMQQNIHSSINANYGQVLEVETNSSGKKNGSLATVRIKPLAYASNLPHISHCRDRAIELCEMKATDSSDVVSSSITSSIPIENLIVIGKSAAISTEGKVDSSQGDFVIRYIYDEVLNQFEHVGRDQSISSKICHRCRILTPNTKIGQCESKNCLETDGDKKWWCKPCIKYMRKKLGFILRRDEVFQCPSCVGRCDCPQCRQVSSIDTNQTHLKARIESSCEEIQSFMSREKAPKNKYENDDRNSEIHENNHHSPIKTQCSCCKAIGNEAFPQNSEVNKRLSCLYCTIKEASNEKLLDEGDVKNMDFVSATTAVMNLMGSADFSIPFDLKKEISRPRSKPIEDVVTKPNQSKLENSAKTSSKRSYSKKSNTSGKRKSPKLSKDSKPSTNEIESRPEDEEEDSQPSCSRTEAYDPSKKLFRGANNSAAHARSSLALMKRGGRSLPSTETRNKGNIDKSSGRAARAKQRRMLKDNFLMTGGVKETMKGCEHALRFGKSIIHGWGVFTDEEINAGDLIVEYRGVLIGHAVADRREIEYENAKIGSDYMFRIDSETVCDATHHGCVARFINASCNPNCHTQIITVNGVKRIAIYAKTKIGKGEELSYDYKFEPEFDESKRIPCNCGSTNCRGFMNWDQKYVAIDPKTTRPAINTDS